MSKLKPLSTVLCVGDPHEPVTRKGYLQFCKDMYRKWKCNTVVIMGDVVDWSAISFHLRNPEGPGPAEEYRLAFEAIHRWYKAFPKAMVCIGNHDCRPQKVAESVNIPAKFIRDYADLWKTPGWKWDHYFILDDVYYFHGRGCGGVHPAWNAMQTKQRSVVMGHCHAQAGIKWLANVDRRTFGMDVGCGIDDKSYAFVYAAEQLKRSILGCGIVAKGVPYHEIMPCGKGERYHDSQFKKEK